MFIILKNREDTKKQVDIILKRDKILLNYDVSMKVVSELSLLKRLERRFIVLSKPRFCQRQVELLPKFYKYDVLRRYS